MPRRHGLRLEIVSLSWLIGWTHSDHDSDAAYQRLTTNPRRRDLLRTCLAPLAPNNHLQPFGELLRRGRPTSSQYRPGIIHFCKHPRSRCRLLQLCGCGSFSIFVSFTISALLSDSIERRGLYPFRLGSKYIGLGKTAAGHVLVQHQALYF